MTMGIREYTTSGTFAATVFALVVALVPFGLEEIGETTGLFKFQARKTLSGWFSFGKASLPHVRHSPPVDWERYRRDLEEFAKWADGRSSAVISLSNDKLVITVEEEVEKPTLKMWPVPVVSCTAGGPTDGKRGYVFISGFGQPFEEGTFICPSGERCGYEIVFIGERTVWLRAVFDVEENEPMGVVKFPEFTRVEGESLVRGNRKYSARDAFPLASGGWLMIDSFLPPDGTVFKILDENRRVVASILCVVIGEKGGR